MLERCPPGAIEAIPCQEADGIPNLEEADCMRAVQFILPDGTRHAGAHALPHILLHVRGWKWMARVLRLPGISLLSPLAYRFIADRRHIFSVLVAEKER